MFLKTQYCKEVRASRKFRWWDLISWIDQCCYCGGDLVPCYCLASRTMNWLNFFMLNYSVGGILFYLHIANCSVSNNLTFYIVPRNSLVSILVLLPRVTSEAETVLITWLLFSKMWRQKDNWEAFSKVSTLWLSVAQSVGMSSSLRPMHIYWVLTLSLQHWRNQCSDPGSSAQYNLG